MTPCDAYRAISHASDEYAEWGLIGCLLYRPSPQSIDPAWFANLRRRVLFIGIEAVRQIEGLHQPVTDHPRDRMEAAHANAERVAFSLQKSGVWEWADDPRAELKRCFDVATLPEMIDYYIKRLHDCYHKRKELTEAEKRLRELAKEVLSCGTI